MKTKLLLLSIFLLSFSSATQVQAQETEIKDTPYFSGMPNYTIYDGEEIEFDSYNFFRGCFKCRKRKKRNVINTITLDNLAGA